MHAHTCMWAHNRHTDTHKHGKCTEDLESYPLELAMMSSGNFREASRIQIPRGFIDRNWFFRTGVLRHILASVNYFQVFYSPVFGVRILEVRAMCGPMSTEDPKNVWAKKKPNKGLRDLLNCRCINEAQRSIVSRTWDTAIISSFVLQEQRDLQVGHCGRTKEECFHASHEKVQACNPHSSGVENSQHL